MFTNFKIYIKTSYSGLTFQGKLEFLLICPPNRAGHIYEEMKQWSLFNKHLVDLTLILTI